MERCEQHWKTQRKNDFSAKGSCFERLEFTTTSEQGTTDQRSNQQIQTQQEDRWDTKTFPEEITPFKGWYGRDCFEENSKSSWKKEECWNLRSIPQVRERSPRLLCINYEAKLYWNQKLTWRRSDFEEESCDSTYQHHSKWSKENVLQMAVFDRKSQTRQWMQTCIRSFGISNIYYQIRDW